MCNQCGQSGCGCKTYRGPKGPKGDRGLSGVNAFKFVKIFTVADTEGSLQITVAEYTQCKQIPAPCILDPADKNLFVDLHVQVWFKTDVGASWSLLNASNDYACLVNATTGTMIISGYALPGNYRVVILA